MEPNKYHIVGKYKNQNKRYTSGVTRQIQVGRRISQLEGRSADITRYDKEKEKRKEMNILKAWWDSIKYTNISKLEAQKERRGKKKKGERIFEK